MPSIDFKSHSGWARPSETKYSLILQMS